MAVSSDSWLETCLSVILYQRKTATSLPCVDMGKSYANLRNPDVDIEPRDMDVTEMIARRSVAIARKKVFIARKRKIIARGRSVPARLDLTSARLDLTSARLDFSFTQWVFGCMQSENASCSMCRLKPCTGLARAALELFTGNADKSCGIIRNFA